ncbi:MAG TPA: hypothetical protein VNQ73_10185 [Ilumatobacter sp.]|nr:hypothetical protein [Ilumatobacter sp.]
MILRPFETAAGDTQRLAEFACSTGTKHEDEVQHWIRDQAVAWINDVPRAEFQRRSLALIEDGDATLAAVAGWQDIVRVDVEGIWIEVLAVANSHQHRGTGLAVYQLVTERLRTAKRQGDHLAGLVHGDNACSKRLLTAMSWHSAATWDEHHELWLGGL